MITILVFLGLIVLALSLSLFLFLILGASIHKSMTIDYSDSWDYGTFDQFIEQFNLIKWKNQPNWSISFFNYPSNSEIHASIVRFNGKGMVLRGVSYIRYELFLHNLPNRNKRKKGLWD